MSPSWLPSSRPGRTEGRASRRRGRRGHREACAAGNVWTSAGDGVRCHEPDGDLIGIIHVPDPVANVCFGGPVRNRLFICATGAVYAVYLLTNGLKLV